MTEYPESLNAAASSQPTDERFLHGVIFGASQELAAALEMVEHCVGQLSDEQIWHREPTLHSVGNTILHLGGNLRQWIVAGLSDADDDRRRPAEFAELGPVPRAQLLHNLRRCVTEAQVVLAYVTVDDLLRQRTIQGFTMTGIGAIWHAVPHFRGHTQELIRQTRTLLGNDYRFAWKPTTPEQGAT